MRTYICSDDVDGSTDTLTYEEAIARLIEADVAMS